MNSREFYNIVVLMRANQKAYYAMAKRANLSPEDIERKKAYLKNSIVFEKEIDTEIERIQAILEEQNQHN